MHRHVALCSQPAGTHGEKRRESVEFSCFQSSLTEHRKLDFFQIIQDLCRMAMMYNLGVLHLQSWEYLLTSSLVCLGGRW